MLSETIHPTNAESYLLILRIEGNLVTMRWGMTVSFKRPAE